MNKFSDFYEPAGYMSQEEYEYHFADKKIDYTDYAFYLYTYYNQKITNFKLPNYNENDEVELNEDNIIIPKFKVKTLLATTTKIEMNEDGFLELECGYFPQSVAEEEMHYKLEGIRNYVLKKRGHKYIGDHNLSSELQDEIENKMIKGEITNNDYSGFLSCLNIITYEGKTYIREHRHLGNFVKRYESAEYWHWFTLEPLKFIVIEETMEIIPKKVVGVQNSTMKLDKIKNILEIYNDINQIYIIDDKFNYDFILNDNSVNTDIIKSNFEIIKKELLIKKEELEKNEQLKKEKNSNLEIEFNNINDKYLEKTKEAKKELNDDITLLQSKKNKLINEKEILENKINLQPQKQEAEKNKLIQKLNALKEEEELIKNDKQVVLSELDEKLKNIENNSYKSNKELIKNNIKLPDSLIIKDKTEGKKFKLVNDELSGSKEFIYQKNSPEELIKSMILSDVAVFLHGPSSEGKSSRIKQFDPDPIIVYLRNATPESLNGKTGYDPVAVESIDIAPSWYEKLEKKCNDEPNKLHIVFFDEFTNAMPAIQGLAFNIILDKEIDGKWILPKNCRIVAAGNEVEDSLAAHEMVEPVYNRFAHVNIKTNAENWLIWAKTPKSFYEKLNYYEPSSTNQKIHPLITAFIKENGESVLRTEFTGKKPNADPRRWQLASKILYTTKNPYDLKPMVGKKLTKQFVEFCKNYKYSLTNILSGKFDYNFNNMDSSEKAMVTSILVEVEEEDLALAISKVKLLGEDFYEFFKSKWIKEDLNRYDLLLEVESASLVNKKRN